MAEPVAEKQVSPDGNEPDAYTPTMQQEVPHPAEVSFFRGTLFQTLVVGLGSFLAPGMYAALSATGAGGLANVEIGNASVAIAYALIVPSALVSTGCLSKLGPRWTLTIGAAGYAPYAAALYCNSAFGTQWFLIVGAVICGATSGLFWVSEGAIVCLVQLCTTGIELTDQIMIYSEPERKGRLLALWQSMYQLATTVGGAINLALNIDINVRGGLRPKTFTVFVALNCIAPLACLLLSNPKQVQRKDGRPVPTLPSKGFWRETWLTILEIRDPRVFACAFLWSQSLFVPSYLSTYLARHFSVRVRGMSSLVKPVLSVIWFQVMGVFLDNKKVSVRWKLLITWGFIQLVFFATTIWLLAINFWMDKQKPSPLYDWATPGFAKYWVPVAIGTACQATAYGYYYYMAGYCFPRSADGSRISRIIATLRSAESGSAAIAFGINSIKLDLWKVGIINLVFLVVCIACGGYVLWWIWGEDKRGAFDDPYGTAPADPIVEELAVQPKKEAE